MGGHKHKGQAQRTKNNAKPANSGRIAELVDKGHHFPSFSGSSNDNTSASTPHPPVTNLVLDVLSPNVDPNFQVVLKKMNKKDATTRFKALQELKELCKASSDKVMTEVLPVWCRVYTLLAIDVEHRVREAVQEVHRQIVSAVGRSLAPHLKTIAPLWFLSQYDTYPPAAFHASSAFQEAFPPHKVSEVIAFCQAEILQYIQDNLLNLTPQALSKGDLSKEEMELKYERIIICSLNGLALYLSKVTPENIKKFENIHREIISSNKFWKFAKYKTPGVRSAWFTLLSSICQYASWLLETEKKHVANTVISSIDDFDSSVLSVVWEAALRSFTTISDFWEHVNIDKFFLPKFCHMLKIGGQGNASCIYPNIILLINSIPASVIKDKQQFYGKIFTSFQEGMKHPIVDQSLSESEAIVSSFIECIQYLILKNIEDTEFCNFILEQHLFNVISSSMLQPSSRNQLKPIPKALYRNLSQMIMHWYKNEENQHFSVLLTKFWDRLTSISIETLKNSLSDKEQLPLILNSQIHILSILKSPTKIYKKNLKVSFDDESKGEEMIDKECGSMPALDKNPIERKFEGAVACLAGQLFSEYYKLSLDNDYKQFRMLFIDQLNTLLGMFTSQLVDVLNSLDPHFSASLGSWILDLELSIGPLISILFDLLSLINLPSQDEIIAQLTKLDEYGAGHRKLLNKYNKRDCHVLRCKESLIEGLKLACQKDNPHLKEWLRSEQLKNEINRLYDLIEAKDSSAFDIVKYFFILDKNGDFVVGNETVLSLLAKLEKQLLSKNETEIDIASNAINVLICNISDKKHELILLRLLDPLFVNIVLGNGNMAYDPWHRGIVILSKSSEGHKCLEMHLQSASNQLGTYITATETTFDVKLIHRAVISLLSALVKNNEKCMDTYGMPCIRLLLSSVFSKAVKETKKNIEEVCMIAEAIHGNLRHDLLATIDIERGHETGNWMPLHHINTKGFVNSLLFSIKLIASALGLYLDTERIDGKCEEDEDAGENVDCLPALPIESSHELYQYVIELAHGLALLNMLQLHYNSVKEYLEINQFMEPLEKYIKELLQMCKFDGPDEIYNLVHTKCEGSDLMIIKVVALIKKLIDDDSGEEFFELEENEEISPGDDFLDPSKLRVIRNLINQKKLSKEKLSHILIAMTKVQEDRSDRDLCEEDKDYLTISGELARVYEAAIRVYPLDLPLLVWDALRIRLVSWLNSMALMKSPHANYIEIVSLIQGSCKLLVTLTKVFQDEEELSKYSTEWTEVFAADSSYSLYTSWQVVVENCQKNGVDPVSFIHVQTLCEVLCYLCDNELPCSLNGDIESIGKHVNTISQCILVPCVPVQFTSYKLLSLLLPYMMKFDENLDESSLDKISCNMLEHILMETQTVVMAMLQDYSIGISCCMEPFTDSYTYSLGYLLLWSLLIQACYRCVGQQKYLYPLWIREKGIISPFIEAVVKLMPESVLYFHESSNKKGQELFTTAPPLKCYGWTSDKLSHLSCWLLTELMGHLPAIVRQWASEVDPKQLSFVDGITTAFISPYLCSREMEAIRKEQKSFDNMKVMTHPSVGEVIAVYTVEESSTELLIQLSSNFPLTPPKVDISKAMISSIQTRQWLKQLTIFLTHQNGSIWDGLILWKSNLDKKFEGVEECYICFSILHNTTHQLPKLSCHTCKKKFHSFCLFKWFSTSNKSTCPICRAIF